MSINTRQKRATSREQKKHPTPVVLRGPLKNTRKPKIQPPATSPSSQPIHPQLNPPLANIPPLLGGEVLITKPHPTRQIKRKSQSLIERLMNLNYEDPDFKKVEEEFFSLITKDFKVLCYNLEPKTEYGKQLLLNGLFWICWYNIIKKSPYINVTDLFTDICKNQLPKITLNKDEFIKIMRNNGIDVNNYNSESQKSLSSKKHSGDKPHKGLSSEPKTKTSRSGKNSSKPAHIVKEDTDKPADSHPTTQLRLNQHNLPSTRQTKNKTKPLVGYSPRKTDPATIATHIESPPIASTKKVIQSPTFKPKLVAEATTNLLVNHPALVNKTSPVSKTFVERMKEARSSTKPEPAIGYPDMNPMKTFLERDEDIKRKLISASDNFVIDFFDINDLYILSEISIVAILENDYKNLGLYCIVLAKKIIDKNNPDSKEFIAISTIKNTNAHNPSVLKEIGQKYQIEAFLVHEQGKEILKHWMSGLNDN